MSHENLSRRALVRGAAASFSALRPHVTRSRFRAIPGIFAIDSLLRMNEAR
jgi:hypothetical protein